MKQLAPRRAVRLLMVLAFAASPLLAQADTKRPLPVEDYDRWRSIGSTTLSPDGTWVTYALKSRTGEDTLTVRNLDDGAVYTVPTGANPQFSRDSRWMAFEQTSRPQTDDADSRGVGLLDLQTGERRSWKGFRTFQFAPTSSHLAIHRDREATDSEAQEEPLGADLLLRDLKHGRDQLLGSVSEFAFNASGELLAYLVDAKDQTGNGVYIVYLQTGRQRILDQSAARHTRLTWDESGVALAALSGFDDPESVERSNSLLAFPDLRSGSDDAVPRLRYEPAQESGFPSGMVLSEKRPLTWKDDRSQVFLGVLPQRRVLHPDPSSPAANVDVFHWRDARIQTVQRAQAASDRRFTFLSAVDLTGRFVPLADSTMRDVQLTDDGNWGVGRDARAYISDWKESRADYYRVDPATGDRTPMLQTQGRTLGLSPDGRHFAYWRDGQVWTYELQTGRTTNLTASASVSFVDWEYDRPGTAPPYGIAGWSSDGTALILNGRYDLWLQPLDGATARNLTGGRGTAEEVRFRVVRTDPEVQTIDLERPLLLSAYGQWTKKSGYFELSAGRLEELIFADRRFDQLQKAQDADRYSFTSSTFRDFPDLYVTDRRFAELERLTDANPQQSEYRWGDRILIEYENKDGVRLQGTLAIPDAYETGQRLPMIVNFYEKKSQELHAYYAPLFEGSYPSGNMGPVAEFAAYVSNGYLVLQADVHFNTGTTHSDMLDCVVAATQKVIELGYADPDRIVLGGGSFSGGGSAYIATQTDMFAAVVARAAPINLAGEFNILFSGSGQNNHSYDIYGQGRYGTNPFDDFELYREQSPITHVASMNTPMLYLHGRLDPSVEYLQGMEFYNALRFLGKPIIFLSYYDEGHNLTKYENQRDFTDRLWQFLDHHLKDVPAPDWMTHGVRFLDRGY